MCDEQDGPLGTLFPRTITTEFIDQVLCALSGKFLAHGLGPIYDISVVAVG